MACTDYKNKDCNIFGQILVKHLTLLKKQKEEKESYEHMILKIIMFL